MAISVDVASYSFDKEDKLFVDANIWLYLFYNDDDYGYGEVFERILKADTELFITDLVLSEYVNRRLRLDFNTYRDNLKQAGNRRGLQYKRDFRPTNEFKENYENAILSVKEDILPLVSLLPVTQKNIHNWFEENNLLDYNDNIYLNLSKDKGLGILTHDKDFLSADCEVRIFRRS
jgi:predicted nucleic acid-binding protein